MRKDRKMFEGAFVQLNMSNAENVVKDLSESYLMLLRNEKVYDGNMQLLARYNAETNLI